MSSTPSLRPTLLGLLALASAFPCLADDILVASPFSRQAVRAAEGRVLVRFRPATDTASALSGAEGIASTDLLPDGQLAILRFAPGRGVEETLRHLRGLPGVVAAEPDYVVRTCVSPRDPLWDQQCGLRRMQFNGAWTHQRGSPDVTIAIIDSGVAYDHPDLNANLRRNAADPPNGVDDDGNGFVDDFRGWDFADGDNDPHASRGDGVGSSHGTHVAGIAAAVTGNGLGVAGAGWSCTYLPVRVVNAFGVGYLSDVARGIEYAVGQGVAVINLSLEGPFSRTIQAAIDYAHQRGVIICAAAGNGALEFTTDPATWISPVCNDGDFPDRSNHVVGVAAIRCDNVKLNVSNYGSAYSFIDVAAPGSRAMSTSWPGAIYERLSGTSQATPHVAGAVGLLVSHLGRIGPDVATNLLRSTAANIDADNPDLVGKLGAGRPDANALLFHDSPGPIEAVSVFVTDQPGGDTPSAKRAMPGQGVDVQVALRNLGMGAVTNVRCRLASGDPNVVVRRDLGWYGSVGLGETKVSASGYRLRIRNGVALGTRVPIRLRIISSDGGPWRSPGLYLPVGWDVLGEPDDTCAEAFPAAPGIPYNRTLGGALDQDWFTFDAAEGQALRFRTLPRAGSSPRTSIAVRDVDCGPELARSDPASQPGTLDWVCPADGRYAVAVMGADDLWTGAYRFRIVGAGTVGSGPVEVTRIAIDDDNLGASAGNGDGRADPGETVELRAELTNRGPLPVTGVASVLSTSRSALTIVSANAEFTDVAQGATAWSQVPYVVRMGAGMYEPTRPLLELDVTADQGAWRSEFRLDVGRSGQGEPDNTCAEGALIQADQFRHPRAFEQSDDRDWFLLDAVAGTSYRIRTLDAGDPGVDTLIALHGPDCGAPVAFDDNSGGGTFSRLDWTCPASGRYGILARPAAGSATGAYELSISPLNNPGPGEPDNWCEQAASVPTDGTPQPRDFGIRRDEDWITFAAKAGGLYIIETRPAPGQVARDTKSPPDGSPRAPDTVLELYDPGCGQRLAVDDDGGEGLFSRVVFTPAQNGDYVARVTEFDDSVGSYQIAVRRNFPPRLGFVGTPGYETDVVEPQTGVARDTRFILKVLYTDPNGDEPEYVRLRLFRTDGGLTIGPLSMRRRAGDPVTGVVYATRRRLPAGQYRCRVFASDGFSDAVGAAARRTDGPLVQEASAGLVTSLTVVPQPPRLAEVRFVATGAGRVTARILNVAGREVKRLATDRAVESGLNTLLWDGSTSLGTRAPRGLYLVEVALHSGDGQLDRRVAPLRW